MKRFLAIALAITLFFALAGCRTKDYKEDIFHLVEKNYDAILAMYHDQGLTPFKTLTPDGVNFSASLDAVRTSPDHGVAYDIAGKGIADEQAMRNALYMAMDIVRRRREWQEWNKNPLEHFEREKGRDISIKDLPEQEQRD